MLGTCRLHYSRVNLLAGSQLHAAMSNEFCVHTSIIVKPFVSKNLYEEEWVVLASRLIAIVYSSVTCAIVWYVKGLQQILPIHSYKGIVTKTRFSIEHAYALGHHHSCTMS